MKKIILVVLVITTSLALLSCSDEVESAPSETIEVRETAEPVKEIVFRNVGWYMTKEEVITSEGREPDIAEETILVFKNVQAGDLPAHVMYIFSNDNELIYAMIPIDNDYNPEGKFVIALDCVHDYEALRDALSSKYGKPIINERNWSEAKYEYEYEAKDWGTATLRGRLKHFSAWSLSDGTTISLELMGQKGKIFLNILYSCEDASEYYIDVELPYSTDESINTEGL